MALLFQRLERGGEIENPRLLSYYVALPGGIRGHTVLQFTAGGRVQIIDPDRPSRVIRIHYANEHDPRSAGRPASGTTSARRAIFRWMNSSFAFPGAPVRLSRHPPPRAMTPHSPHDLTLPGTPAPEAARAGRSARIANGAPLYRKLADEVQRLIEQRSLQGRPAAPRSG